MTSFEDPGRGQGVVRSSILRINRRIKSNLTRTKHNRSNCIFTRTFMIMNYIFDISNISFRKNFLIFTNYIIDVNIKFSHPIIIIFNKKITTINSIILKRRNNFKDNIIVSYITIRINTFSAEPIIESLNIFLISFNKGIKKIKSFLTTISFFINPILSSLFHKVFSRWKIFRRLTGLNTVSIHDVYKLLTKKTIKSNTKIGIASSDNINISIINLVVIIGVNELSYIFLFNRSNKINISNLTGQIFFSTINGVVGRHYILVSRFIYNPIRSVKKGFNICFIIIRMSSSNNPITHSLSPNSSTLSSFRSKNIRLF